MKRRMTPDEVKHLADTMGVDLTPNPIYADLVFEPVKPTPICRAARLLGEVPIGCLFHCPFKPSCGETHSLVERRRKADEHHAAVMDDFEEVKP